MIPNPVLFMNQKSIDIANNDDMSIPGSSRYVKFLPFGWFFG